MGTLFFMGSLGGVMYRINGAPSGVIGPYAGGDLNYIKQGVVFAAAGRARGEMNVVINIWNYSGAGSVGNLSQRIYFSGIGYYYYKIRKEGGHVWKGD